MFYLKHKGIRLYIESDNVYNSCPRCGKECHVDLEAVLADGKSDLYGTAVYCRECSEKLVKEAEANERI